MNNSLKDMIKGIEGLVVHSEVYNKLNNPSPVDDKLIKMCYEQGKKVGLLEGRKQGALEILDKLKIAKQCIDYQNIKCDNKDCLNKVCPLNKNFKELESGVSK